VAFAYGAISGATKTMSMSENLVGPRM